MTVGSIGTAMTLLAVLGMSACSGTVGDEANQTATTDDLTQGHRWHRHDGGIQPAPDMAGAGASAPVASITSPASGATLSGTVTFLATATDPDGIAHVAMYVNGMLWSDELQAPYGGSSLDTRLYASGPAELKIVAYDTLGNKTTQIITATIANAVVSATRCGASAMDLAALPNTSTYVNTKAEVRNNTINFQSSSYTPGSAPVVTACARTAYTGTIDYRVSTLAQLRAALGSATSGQVVYVEDSASIDMSSQAPVTLKGGVTLMSGRGVNGSSGGIIRSLDYGYKNGSYLRLIDVTGPDAKIIGLRIEGPDKDTHVSEIGYDGQYWEGIRVGYNARFTVSDCELWGFAHIAIVSPGDDSLITRSYIHHNQLKGYGYGVETEDALDIQVIDNTFDSNRHDIASGGTERTSYIASGNVSYRNNHPGEQAFDVHGGVDRGDGTDIAGRFFHIHDNVFFSTGGPGFWIRGTPTQKSVVEDNVFAHSSIVNALEFDSYSPF